MSQARPDNHTLRSQRHKAGMDEASPGRLLPPDVSSAPPGKCGPDGSGSSAAFPSENLAASSRSLPCCSSSSQSSRIHSGQEYGTESAFSASRRVYPTWSSPRAVLLSTPFTYPFSPENPFPHRQVHSLAAHRPVRDRVPYISADTPRSLRYCG